jgi:molecular chaperone GrpE
MIYTNFVSLLNAKEVKEIECLGKEFDPNFMEAVLTSKEEGVPKNQVMEVLQKGYMYKDKLLRAAMVRVSE